MFRSKLAFVTLAALALVGAAGAQQPQKMKVQDLGTLPNGVLTFPTRLNSVGRISGFVAKRFGESAFYHNGTSLNDIGALPGASTARARWINRAGTIAGTSGTGNARRAFRWFNGVMLDATPGVTDPTDGIAINDGGTYVYDDLSPLGQWTVTFNTRYNAIIPPVTAGAITFGAAINALDVVLGREIDPDGEKKCWVFEPPVGTTAGTTTEIGAKRTDDTEIEGADIADINLLGGPINYLVAGTVGFMQAGTLNQSVLNSAGFVGPTFFGIVYPPPLGFDNVTECRGINNSNVVCGRSGLLSNTNGELNVTWRACMWLPILPIAPIYVAFDPNEFIPVTANVRLDSLLRINDSGQMVGTYTQNGLFRGILLTPVITPDSLTFDQTTIYGGDSTVGHVTVDGTSTSVMTVKLTSSNGIVQVPPTVSIPVGANGANFNVRTSAVSVSTPVTVTAEKDTFKILGQLRVNPTVLGSLAITPNPITGGLNVTGTVTLFGVAPSGGSVVNLSSANTGLATVPASVTVAANAKTKTFTVNTAVVAARTTVKITAQMGSISKVVTLTLVTPFLQDLTLSTSSVMGGNNVTGTVTLSNNSLPPSSSVTLLSSVPSKAQVPATVSVPGGSKTATFTITTTPTVTSTVLLITARFGGVSISRDLTVRGPQLTRIVISSPTTVLGGEQNTHGFVYLDGPAPGGGAVVQMSSSDGAAANVPGTVTIPAGKTYVIYYITSGIIESTRNVTIVATYLTVTKTATMTVQAADLISNSVIPSLITPVGAVGTGIVTLNRPAQAGGAVVLLTSSNTNVAVVPGGVVVPQGATSATYPVFSLAAGSATITATRGTNTFDANITVQ